MRLAEQGLLSMRIAAIFLIAFSTWAATEEMVANKFLSWYDGWGSHTVWGLGKISGSYADASVKCGKESIKVVPIYDTHIRVQPPNEAQSSDFAKTHNLTVANELSKKGVRCEFEQTPR